MRPPRVAVVGESLDRRLIGPVSRADIVRFAGAGGDFNPLHHDPEFARAAGFDDVIAMGQYQAGLLAALLSDLFGVENVFEFGVRFVRPVGLGDTVELSGEVMTVTGVVADLKLTASVEGEPVVTGTARVRVQGEDTP
jgi:3-hydroxybutyryl-CoA dehydratase